ncbi:twin-arginine translocation pathway signal [Rhodobacterales bacterium]|nr:twin-arginine translocation pathway signal [Rhodobacterales bacterium]
MSPRFQTRRSFLLAAGAAGLLLAPSPLRLTVPAMAKGVEPTPTMRGGSNNYRPGAPLVERLGSGFWVKGTVRRAGDGAPLSGVRVQIWAATVLGGEREPRNHGSVLTAADGSFRLETEQIVPNFGQPHAHLAYDDGDFKTVFLRPVMPSASDTSVSAHFVLAPA